MIVPVKRVNLVLLPEEKTAVFIRLQKSELFMVKGFNVQNHALFNHDELVKTQKVIKILEAHQKKKSLFATITVDHHALDQTNDDEVKIVDKIIDLENQIGEKVTTIQRLKEINVNYLPFTFLSVAQERLGALELIKFGAYKLKEEKKDYLEKALSNLKMDFEIGVYDKVVYLVVALLESAKEDLSVVLNAVEAEEITLPTSERPYHLAIEANSKKIELLEKELLALNTLIDEQVVFLPKVKTYYDKKANQLIREHVPHKDSAHFIVLEGYVRSDQITKLDETLKSVASTYEIEVIEETKEPLPTALKNNKFVAPFETITESFSIPNTKELDPNPVMSIWYWLFFGMMIADLGYGLVLFIGTLLMLKLKKPRGGFKKLLQVFLYSSISTMIFGLVTGSLFGVGFREIIPSLPAIFISPVDDPMIVLVASLVFGAFHIMTALVMKTITMIRQKDFLGALAEAVSWILILFFGLIFIADMMSLLWTSNSVISYISLGFIFLGLAFIIFLSGRGNKNPFTWVMKGLGGLYGATSYLSDILSYSRLLALALSGAVIAFTMNLLAGMVAGGLFGLGYIFAVLIILAGHIFNFAISLLSAYVHGGRLQYLEFYGKFYQGGGFAFKPLGYELHYINEIKEN